MTRRKDDWKGWMKMEAMEIMGAEAAQGMESAREAGDGQAEKAEGIAAGAREAAGSPTVAEPSASRGAEKHAAPSPEAERGQAFEKLIKGEYRDEFAKRTQRIIDQRFKQTRELESRWESAQPMLQALAGRYGVRADDLDALSRAVEGDLSYAREESARHGMDVETFQTWKRTQAENERLRYEGEQREQAGQRAQMAARWTREAEAAAGAYPGFDLLAEARHPQTGKRFLTLMRNGESVKSAYEIVHRDELMTGALRYAAQEAQRRAMDDIRARGLRPDENGASGSAAADTSRKGLDQLTRAEREAIHRRVMRGEIIRPARGT